MRFGQDDFDDFLGRSPAVFSFRAYPVSKLPGSERTELNYGGKSNPGVLSLTPVLLPPSTLQTLSTLHIAYPMIFNLASSKANTHAGVLEFIAAEGHVYLPRWMFAHLKISPGIFSATTVTPGDILSISTTQLPLGKFVKIQPQSTAFLGITDPKAVLEHAFRSFTTLTKGDIFTISYNSTTYDILVLEVKPESASSGISIIETDLKEVDFAAPLGYVEPERTVKTTSIEEHVVKDEVFVAMSGTGNTVKGRAVIGDASESGIPPALILPLGKLYFGYPITPLKSEATVQVEKFAGDGNSLRVRKD